MAGRLEGKICVVTGATRGIGRGCAVALAEEGATIYITGRSNGDGELTLKAALPRLKKQAALVSAPKSIMPTMLKSRRFLKKWRPKPARSTSS